MSVDAVTLSTAFQSVFGFRYAETTLPGRNRPLPRRFNPSSAFDTLRHTAHNGQGISMSAFQSVFGFRYAETRCLRRRSRRGLPCFNPSSAFDTLRLAASYSTNISTSSFQSVFGFRYAETHGSTPKPAKPNVRFQSVFGFRYAETQFRRQPKSNRRLGFNPSSAFDTLRPVPRQGARSGGCLVSIRLRLSIR